VFVGSKVWVNVKDESKVFEFGEVKHISHDLIYSITTQSGMQLHVEGESFKVTQDQMYVNDLLHLSDFSEESLLHALRERYKKDEFYSMVGPILISINPYKWCDIYSHKVMESYRGKRQGQVAPHVFLTAENAYRAVVEDTEKCSQAIIISGESGAGKTEATKIILQYLSSAGKKFNKSQQGTARRLEQKVLDSNPLLEAFGNAKTIRNDNSSRFGKFIEIDIENTGLISGARIINYLLEKSRIIRQAEGERNYHIFYQLLRGGDKALLKEIGLLDAREDELRYVELGSNVALFDENDEANFQRTVNCMETIGVGQEEQFDVFRTISGVLLLGQIYFEDEEEGCSCSDEELKASAGVLKLDADLLRDALCTNTVFVGTETIKKPLSAQVAEDKRDALAKALYALLFRWLILRINASLQGGGDLRFLKRTASFDSASMLNSAEGRSIGILDIYGFEVFEKNSFEQFCINFANEKLQRHFNKHIFEVEQEEYAKENIDWSRIEFNDNQPCLDLIDTSPVSLLSLLDEECLMPRGSDQSLLRKLHTNHRDRNVHYVYPRFGNDTCFGVHHYAGIVNYSVQGFLQKNNDSLSEGLATLMQESESMWFQSLFGGGRESKRKTSLAPKQRQRKRAASLRPPTVSEQFRRQLGSLVAKLERCDPHFVRCIKPNETKSAGLFHSQKCMDQLRYAGMLETIRIRDQGYALREPHDEFFRRFRVLAPNAKSCKDLVRQICVLFGLADASQWQIGNTKVFLRRELAEILDRTVASRITAAARSIAGAFRQSLLNRKVRAVKRIEAFFARVHFKVLVRKIVKVQAFIRGIKARLEFVIVLQEKGQACTELVKEAEEPPKHPETTTARAPLPKKLESPAVKVIHIPNPVVVSKKEPIMNDSGKEQKDGDGSWTQREILMISRLRDLEGFVTTIYDELDPEGTKVQPKTMEEAMESLSQIVKRRIRNDDGLKRHAYTLEDKVRELKEENQHLKEAALKTSSSLFSQPQPSSPKSPLEEKVYALERSFTQEIPSSITALMKENIALMDEIVETRARHNAALKRLSRAESRAEHAEQANETLCTLLSWRDEQIENFVGSSSEKNKQSFQSNGKLEKAVKNLLPYLQNVARRYETKLEE